MLAAAEWDVALLQEAPPRFSVAAGRRLRRRGAPGADLAQPARLAARGSRSTQPRPDRLRRGRLQPHPRSPVRPAWRHRRTARAGDPRRQAGAPRDGLHPHCLRCLRRQPARDQRLPGAGRRGRAARRPHRDRVGRRARRSYSAATSTCAPPRAPASSSSCASASAWRRRPPPTRSTICWPAAWRCSNHPPPGRLSGGRFARASASCASPTTPPSKRGLQPAMRGIDIVTVTPAHKHS